MTLILAIQAKDSIIISTDKRMVCDKNKDMKCLSFHSGECKLYLWQKGIITGGGELQVIKRTVRWLQQNQDINSLPNKLIEIKKERIVEMGQHDQITLSGIVFSVKETDNDIPQLYSTGFDHQLEKLEPSEIIIRFPFDHQFSDESMSELKSLHSSVKDYNEFTTHQSWLNYYLDYLSKIYKDQSLHCDKISADFHVFFQARSYSTMVHMIND